MRFTTILLLLILPLTSVLAKKTGGTGEPAYSANNYKMPAIYFQKAAALYDSLNLQKAGLEKDVFFKAYKGYLYLLSTGVVGNGQTLSIADLSQSSRNKRLYIIDLQNQKLLFNTYVSHGKNSGGEMATSFSNQKDSYKSVLGFLITSDTYSGRAGYSLRFQGMEAGINDQVSGRSIVVHGSRFVNEERAEERGKVGNSLGCPAVPMAQSRPIIDAIKGGSVYFIYHPDEFYNASSPVLNAEFNSITYFPFMAAPESDDTLLPPPVAVKK